MIIVQYDCYHLLLFYHSQAEFSEVDDYDEDDVVSTAGVVLGTLELDTNYRQLLKTMSDLTKLDV